MSLRSSSVLQHANPFHNCSAVIGLRETCRSLSNWGGFVEQPGQNLKTCILVSEAFQPLLPPQQVWRRCGVLLHDLGTVTGCSLPRLFKSPHKMATALSQSKTACLTRSSSKSSQRCEDVLCRSIVQGRSGVNPSLLCGAIAGWW
jgi:hypothetical protein